MTTKAPSFRDAARTIKADPAIELPTGAELTTGWLTQFGTDYFREQPRFEVEYDVSTIMGKLTLEQTVYAMFGRKPSPAHRHRHFDVAKLRSMRAFSPAAPTRPTEPGGLTQLA